LALSVSCLNLIDLIGLFNFRKYIILLKTNNHFAYYIGGILIIVIVMLYDKNKTFRKINLLPVIVFVTSLISAVVLTLGVFAVYNKKYKTVFIMALIFIIVYFNFDSLPYNIQRTLLSITNIWSASIQMIKEHPLVGVGIDNWRYYYLLPETPTIFYLFMFAINIYYSIYVFKRTKNEIRKCIALSSIMFFVFTIIYCMVNNPLFNSKPAMLFYIIAGKRAWKSPGK